MSKLSYETQYLIDELWPDNIPGRNEDEYEAAYNRGFRTAVIRLALRLEAECLPPHILHRAIRSLALP